MATKVIMPKQGLQMTEGTITRWLVPEGGQAVADQPLFEMETDKLTIEIMAPASGTLLKILRPEGDTVPITEAIAIIGEPGEDISALTGAGTGTEAATEPAAQAGNAAAAGSADGSAIAAGTAAAASRPGETVYVTPRARMKAEEAGIDATRLRGTGPEGLVIERDVLAAAATVASTAAAPAAEAPRATPTARRIAGLNAIDLAAIAGQGPGGKIMKADVQAFQAAMAQPQAQQAVQSAHSAQPQAQQAGAAAGAAAPSAAVAARAGRPAVPAGAGAGRPAVPAGAGARGERGERLVPMSGMRKVIADRMATSLHTMAQANHRMKVDMGEVVRFREKLKESGVKVSFTDIIVRCVAKALTEFPIINASLTDKGILYKDYVNIGFAVAVPNGLIVPVIKDADLLGLSEIAATAAGLAEKAKSGTLTQDDYSGGTFTISNLGMFDVDEFTAIVNPPESAILAIGKIDRIPVAVGDEVVIRPIMVLSLSYDHRTIDGAPAAQFLQRVKQILQNPYLLI